MDITKKAQALERFVFALLECDRDLPIYIIQALEDITRAIEENDIEELEVTVKWFADSGE